jgi:hypothetical protein
MLRLVSAIWQLLMTYSFGNPRSALRGEDQKESVGSTIIFSDLTFVGWPTSGRSRGVLKRQGCKAVSVLAASLLALMGFFDLFGTTLCQAGSIEEPEATQAASFHRFCDGLAAPLVN